MHNIDLESLDANIADQMGSFDYSLYREIYKWLDSKTDINGTLFYPLYQKVRNKVSDDMTSRSSLLYDKLLEYIF